MAYMKFSIIEDGESVPYYFFYLKRTIEKKPLFLVFPYLGLISLQTSTKL